MRRQANRRRSITARQIANSVPTQVLHVSDQTVRNRLREAGLRARRLARISDLTYRHRHERLNYARTYVTWRAYLCEEYCSRMNQSFPCFQMMEECTYGAIEENDFTQIVSNPV